MKKRIFSLLLTILTLLSLLAPKVNAAEDAPYSDVSIGDWYFQPVTFCKALGLMNGIGQGQFAPAGSINRAMFVTILHRLAGSPDAAPCGFDDVSDGSYYAEAVAWAAEQGIVQGTGDSTFSPERCILRQDMACMLARYILSIDAELLRGPACEQAFLDIDLVSDYARESVEVMRRTGLFQGDEASNFRPLDTANRAEAATLFTRLALALEIIPEPGILEAHGESCPLSVEDTIWLYNCLSALSWQEGEFAEYIPTHTLTIWNGEYQFYLFGDNFVNAVNYVCGNSYLGGYSHDTVLLRRIYELFAAYLPE